MKGFINILDHDRDELEQILTRAAELKARLKAGIPDHGMRGKILAMYFEKPSTRTRFSLETAAVTLGGHAIHENNTRLGDREAVRDVARVVSRYVDLVSIRTFGHDILEEFAKYADVPVINALSDHSHPTQAMADVMTMREHLGDTRGKKLVYIGDGNNVALSLAALCGRLGIRFGISCPEGYGLSESTRTELLRECPDMDFSEEQNPKLALADADVAYTDVWVSMGMEEEAARRKAAFAPYQLNEELLRAAKQGCKIMHCLPAHRGEEITDGVMDAPESIVFDQAENRMHLYRGLFAHLMGF